MVCTASSSGRRVFTAYSVCLPLRLLAGCTPRLRLWPSCPRWMRWMCSWTCATLTSSLQGLCVGVFWGWGGGRGGEGAWMLFSSGGGGWLCVLLSRGRQGCACVGGAEPGCMLRVVYSACLSGGRPVTFAPACRITPKWGVRHKGLGRGAGRRGQMEAEGGGGGVRGLLCCMSRLTHSCILQSCPPAADELCPCLPPPSFSLTLHAGRRVQEVRM